MSVPDERPESWGERGIALAEAFVTLADTLLDGFEASDHGDRLVRSALELLGTEAAGLLIRDGRGRLGLGACTSEESRLLELYQVQIGEGPCLESVATGHTVAVDELTQGSERWPEFAKAAGALGFASVYAFPLRLRGDVVGGLDLFGVDPGALGPEDRRVGQALADVTAIGLLQHRARHEAVTLAEQLQRALNSRVVIEQAKGMLAGHARIDVDAAFEAIRQFARNHNRKLAEVAKGVVRRSLSLDTIVARKR